MHGNLLVEDRLYLSISETLLFHKHCSHSYFGSALETCSQCLYAADARTDFVVSACVPDCGVQSLVQCKLRIMVVFNCKARKQCRVASNWLRTKLNYQGKQGSPNSESEWIS